MTYPYLTGSYSTYFGTLSALWESISAKPFGSIIGGGISVGIGISSFTGVLVTFLGT